MSEYFRRVIVKFFLEKELISAKIATSLKISIEENGEATVISYTSEKAVASVGDAR